MRVDLSGPNGEVPAHKTAAIFTHLVVPTAGFHIVDPLVQLGLSTMTVQTRFVGHDATLLMERCAQDVGTAVRFLKERGDERIILLAPEQLPAADKLVLFGHHLGRSQTLRNVLDAAVVGQADPLQRDPDLDANGPTDVARTTIPVLSIRQAGDHRAHPDYLRKWEEALGDRFTGHHEFDAAHYMDTKAQAEMVAELAQLIHDFATR